ncbi:hypothetical protein [Streptomyces sp. NPDC052042]|uniref:hypothetical protein n=1 Tax=Streptomyces sp. NPDC052042 TaxID=3365683 RepID=UPI0037D4AEA4
MTGISRLPRQTMRPGRAVGTVLALYTVVGGAPLRVPERYVPLDDEQTLSAATAPRLGSDLRKVTLVDGSDVAGRAVRRRGR